MKCEKNMKGLTYKTEVRIISSYTNNSHTNNSHTNNSYTNNSQTNSLDANKSFGDCCVTGML